MCSSATAVKPIVHSAIQKQVLSLYRQSLRLAARKSPSQLPLIKHEFRVNQHSIKRTDGYKIEFLLKQLKKKIDIISDPTVKGVQIRHT